MDQEEQQRYREMIAAQIEELRQSLAEKDETTAAVKLDNAIGRLTRVDAMQSQQMAMELRRRRLAKFERLQRALRLIDQGKFGICSKCGEDIIKARLELYPDVRMCVSCASRLERPSPWWLINRIIVDLGKARELVFEEGLLFSNRWNCLTVAALPKGTEETLERPQHLRRTFSWTLPQDLYKIFITFMPF